MTDFRSVYQSKLTTPEAAVGRICSGMAMTEPPAPLKALADRAAAGKVDGLKIYYFESTEIAGGDGSALRTYRTHSPLSHVCYCCGGAH